MTTDHRQALLRAALGFLTLRWSVPPPPAIALAAWLDSWTGIGLIAVGMHRQYYDLQLTQYDDRGWRATFFMTGMEHSIIKLTASAFQPTPWRAVQQAAWETLQRNQANG